MRKSARRWRHIYTRAVAATSPSSPRTIPARDCAVRASSRPPGAAAAGPRCRRAWSPLRARSAMAAPGLPTSWGASPMSTPSSAAQTSSRSERSPRRTRRVYRCQGAWRYSASVISVSRPTRTPRSPPSASTALPSAGRRPGSSSTAPRAGRSPTEWWTSASPSSSAPAPRPGAETELSLSCLTAGFGSATIGSGSATINLNRGGSTDEDEAPQEARGTAQSSLVRRQRPALLRPPVAHRADGLFAVRLRGQAGDRDHQYLERHQLLPQPLPPARRGGEAGGVAGRRLSGRDAGDLARRAVPEADHDALSQPARDGDRGASAQLPRRRLRAHGRVRQDDARAGDGRSVDEPADDLRPRWPDAARRFPRQLPRER